jgi:acyl-coenzyme A thioesterase PaaI-like protein
MTSGTSPADPVSEHPSGVEQEPDIRASAIAAVARTRAHGLHYYGQILGITAAATNGGPARLRLDPDRAVTPGPVPPVALATIADLAMGSSIRDVVGAGRRLGTVSMTLHHIAPVVTAPVIPAPRVIWLDDEQRNGLAGVDLTDATGAPVGAGLGWFMVLPVPDSTNLRLLPWELHELPHVPPVACDELEAHEVAAVEATVRAAERARARGTSVSEELTALTWDESCSEGTARGSLRIGPELTNRVGHVQGGALYGIGIAAAAKAVTASRPAGGPLLEPADGSWQFLRPGDGAVLVAEATVSRVGRAAAFASVTVTVDGRAVGAGQFAFRPSHEG